MSGNDHDLVPANVRLEGRAVDLDLRVARIAAERAPLHAIAELMAIGARRLAERIGCRGMTAICTHGDVDNDTGLAGLEALLKLRGEVAHQLAAQIVAFPQSGAVRHLGGAAILEEAIRAGADVVDGLDPAGIDDDAEAQFGIVFGIAEAPWRAHR